MIRRPPVRSARALLALACAGAALGACDNSPRPPGDLGVCYQYVTLKNGASRFNVVQKGAPNLETCAAALEAVRLRFLRLGGNRTTMVGAYQSKFLFLEPEGIFTSDSLNGATYIALVRTADGRLAQPGAVRR